MEKAEQIILQINATHGSFRLLIDADIQDELTSRTVSAMRNAELLTFSSKDGIHTAVWGHQIIGFTCMSYETDSMDDLNKQWMKLRLKQMEAESDGESWKG